MELTPLKCVVVGDGAVGKTSLLLSFTKKSFDLEYMPTVFDNYSAVMMVRNRPINYNLWDTAGQEEYDRLRSLSYPQTDVFIVVFSVVSRASFQNVKQKWVPEIRTYNPSAKIILCGSKIDLRIDQEALARLRERNLETITTEEGIQLQKEIEACSYMEVSSRTHTNINSLFEEVAICSDAFNLLVKKGKPRSFLKPFKTFYKRIIKRVES